MVNNKYCINGEQDVNDLWTMKINLQQEILLNKERLHQIQK